MLIFDLAADKKKETDSYNGNGVATEAPPELKGLDGVVNKAK